MARHNEHKSRHEAYVRTDALLHGGASKDRYYQDDTGQWWYRLKNGSRMRATLRECAICGSDFVTHDKLTKSCSKRQCRRTMVKLWWQRPEVREKRRGANSTHWKGGERTVKGGYVYVYLPDHPSLFGTKRKYVRRCRWVMECVLGRPLKSFEEVHHINGLKDDDRPENLELWIKSHPAGVRASDGKHCPTCTCHLHHK